MADNLTRAQEHLAELLKQMGAEAEVAVSSQDPPVLSVNTERPGSLIGSRGEGIRSLQHLLRLWLVRNEIELPVAVDIDGYRQQREDQLTQMAQRKAEEVSRTGRLAVLAPMTSYERRVIHTTLSEAEGVVTESLGEGGNRRVMIKKAE